MQEPYLSDRQTMPKLLNGISMHKYRESTELIPEVFGISASNLSRGFKKASAEMLRRLKTCSLVCYDFAAIFLDGKKYADVGLIVALGVTIEGKNVILDIEQSHSENSVVIKQFLGRLIERDLRFEGGILFIVNGSKGIISAIRQQFQEYAFIQRCQWHKQQNVTSYLNESQKQICKRKLKQAYQKTIYHEAKADLENIHQELLQINQSAANSLIEGLEETLTLHKLELSHELCRSFNSTNCIESIIS